MNFKELAKKDIHNTFFNDKEFSEVHLINGKEKNIIIDNDQLEEIKAKDKQGIFEGDTLFFIKHQDVDFNISIGKILKFDENIKRINNVSLEDGIYMIVLEENIG